MLIGPVLFEVASNPCSAFRVPVIQTLHVKKHTFKSQRGTKNS